jgi:hypothetical protein
MFRIHECCLSPHILECAIATFPPIDWHGWHRYGNGKRASVDYCRIPRNCDAALQYMASSIPPQVDGVFWDLDLHGAGLHCMPPGTSLGRHLDAEFHPMRPWRREMSAVLFLDTLTSGALQIGEMSVLPVRNRLVVFSTDQWHEVCQTHDLRRTLCLFGWRLCDDTKTFTSAKFERANE